MTGTSVAAEHIRFSPRRRRLRRRILAFSFSLALAAVFLGGLLFYFTEVYLPGKRLEETNQKTFGRIDCDPQTCDITGIAADWEFVGSDYVLDKHNCFVLGFDSADKFLDPLLQYSDSAIMRRFKTPYTLSTPSRESWRLHWAEKQIGAKRAVVMVGYAMKASWKMDLPIATTALIDQKLKEELTSIADALRVQNGELELPPVALKKITSDGYVVVDLANNKIVREGYQIPIYFPHDKPLPSQGMSFHGEGSDLYLVRTDANERLFALTSQLVGDLRFLGALFALLFLIAGLAAYISGSTFLRKYFVFSQTQPQTVEQALKTGEGASVEFKRNFSADAVNSVEQLLQTVAAFANTGDGTVFIGIDDDGKIKGIALDGTRQRDQFSQRIYQAVRTRIRPAPSIQVDFVDVRSFAICRVLVPRGEEPLHFLDGIIYIRYGSSDVKAQPDLMKKLLAEYAF
jgi:hypothetical protein